MLDVLYNVLVVCGCILAAAFTLCILIVLITAIAQFIRNNWKK